jgi:hypothetical protein
LNYTECVCCWLFYQPYSSAVWTNYEMTTVRLREVAGLAPPRHQYPGTTHEIVVSALNPEYQPYTNEDLLKFLRREMPPEAGFHRMRPANIVFQFEGTDEEAKLLSAWAAWGVTQGQLNPENWSAPDAMDVRLQWMRSLIQTLAHLRGEPHGDHSG